jgi:hypothetical protein
MLKDNLIIGDIGLEILYHIEFDMRCAKLYKSYNNRSDRCIQQQEAV